MATLHADPILVTDWIVTAFEGGIDYWCSDADYLDEKLFRELRDDQIDIGSRYPVYSLSEYWERGGRMKLRDAETGEWYKPFDYNMLTDALSLDCISNQVAKRLLNEDYDADDADLIIQATLFGEIVYG